jgi:hypothetical protein
MDDAEFTETVLKALDVIMSLPAERRESGAKLLNKLLGNRLGPHRQEIIEMPTKAQPDEWLTLGQAAELTGVTYQHWYNMANKGIIAKADQKQAVPPGRKNKKPVTYVRRMVVEAFKEKQAQRRRTKDMDLDESSVSGS